MSIREVVQTEEQGPLERRQRMIKVTVTEDLNIYATWRVVPRIGRPREVTTQVTPALAANITGRPGFQVILDQIRDDTIGRIGA